MADNDLLHAVVCVEFSLIPWLAMAFTANAEGVGRAYDAVGCIGSNASLTAVVAPTLPDGTVLASPAILALAVIVH